MSMSNDWKTYAKAITGALVAALTALGTALDDGVVSTQEGVVIALALVTGLAAVWAVPNATPDEPLDMPESATGQTDEGDPADDTVVESEEAELGEDEIVGEPHA